MTTKTKRKTHVLSFDIGVKNFCYCLERYDDLPCANPLKDGVVLDICNTCLTEDGRKTPGPQVFDKISNILENIPSEYVDVVLVEKQVPKNTKAVMIAQHVWTWFRVKYPGKIIEMYPAKYKTSVFGWRPKEGSSKSSSYTQRKKWAVNTSLELLTSRGDTKTLEIFHATKKKDDMADCLLMCISYVVRTGE